MEFGRVLKKGLGKYRRRVREGTGKGSGQVPEKGPGKYRKRVESGRVSEKGPGQYRKRVESGRDFGKRWNLGEY